MHCLLHFATSLHKVEVIVMHGVALVCKRKVVVVPREGIIRGSASNLPGTGMEAFFSLRSTGYVTSS